MNYMHIRNMVIFDAVKTAIDVNGLIGISKVSEQHNIWGFDALNGSNDIRGQFSSY